MYKNRKLNLTKSKARYFKIDTPAKEICLISFFESRASNLKADLSCLFFCISKFWFG